MMEKLGFLFDLTAIVIFQTQQQNFINCCMIHCKRICWKSNWHQWMSNLVSQCNIVVVTITTKFCFIGLILLLEHGESGERKGKGGKSGESGESDVATMETSGLWWTWWNIDNKYLELKLSKSKDSTIKFCKNWRSMEHCFVKISSPTTNLYKM